MTISSINIDNDTIVIAYSNLSKLRSAVKDEVVHIGFQYSYITADGLLKSFLPLSLESLVAAYKLYDRGFVVDDDILLSKVLEIKNIFDNKDELSPSLARSDNKWILNNATEPLHEYLNSLVEKNASDASILMRMKLAEVNFSERCGSDLTSEILHTKNNHFLINESTWSLDSLIETIKEIDAFPLLVVLQEGSKGMVEMFERIVRLLENRITTSNIVSLVLPQKPYHSIHCKVRELSVGRKINDSSKVVFIGSNFLSTEFKKSDWFPFAVLYLSSHNFGTVGNLVKNYPVVFYHNTLIRSLF